MFAMSKRPNDDSDVEMECAQRSKGCAALMTKAAGKWSCSVCNEWHCASAYKCKFFVMLGNDKHYLFSCLRCTRQYQQQRAQQYQQALGSRIQGSAGSSAGTSTDTVSTASGSAGSSTDTVSNSASAGSSADMELD